MGKTICEERLAAIDIGTNSTRLLVAVTESGGVVHPLFTALRTTRIGEGYGVERRLRPEPIDRTLAALAAYKDWLRQYRVNRWRIVATAAVREAVNREEFVALVKAELGLRVEIISGVEEARLSYLGACRSLPGVKRAVVIDIGGGSTEFTWPDPPAYCLESVSIPLGAVRLTERPLLRAKLASSFQKPLRQIRRSGITPLIGVGGTVTTLAAVDQRLATYDRNRVHGYRLKRQTVERILSWLAAKDIEERKDVPGLQPERADIIVAGTTILQHILSELAEETIIVSEADLLDGMIRELWTVC